MDSTENSLTDSFKSKKIIHLKGNQTPSPSGKLLRRHQDSSQWSSKTPEKPVDPPRRTRNRGAAFSLKEVREAAMKLRISDPVPIEKPEPLLAEQIPISPVSKPKRPESSFSLPEKYEMLDKLFRSLDNSIRLCRVKGSVATFTNVSPKIECLSDRRFTYSLLAQMKFILPEAIEIKTILVHDVRTSCMKPDLLLTLDDKAVEDSKNDKLESGSFLLRKIFRSRLVDYFKAHPQDDDIPEDDLPHPFNASKTAHQTNREIIQESSTSTLVLQTAPSEGISGGHGLMLVSANEHINMDQKQLIKVYRTTLPLSHMSPSFRRSFSQKAITKIPNQVGTWLGIVGSGTLSRVSVPSFTHLNPKMQYPLPETASPTPKKLTPLATPIKCTISEAIENPSIGTPMQSDSTPAKLTSAASRLAPPKRCYLTPDNDDVTKSVNKLVIRPSRSRSLKFDNTTERIHELEDGGDEKGCLSIDNDILDVLPESLVRSIQEKETKALMEKDPAISQAKRRQQLIAGLPKLFDMIYFLLQWRSVITKEEILHKVISFNLDIRGRKEAEEQLRLLQELAPEWIYEKNGIIWICPLVRKQDIESRCNTLKDCGGDLAGGLD